MEELKNIVMLINDKTAEFNNNAAQNVLGNKAAGARARKTSLELEKLFKQYRKLSVEASK